MKTLTEEAKKIYDLIEKYEPVRSSELIKIGDISSKNLYKHLGVLLDHRLIQKTGSTPKVYYSLSDNQYLNIDTLDINDLLVENNYIFVSPSGDILRGNRGFSEWCSKNNFDIEKEKKLFVKTILSTKELKVDDLISAKNRILSGKKEVYLDDIFFSDFYTQNHFGKTKLGQLVYVGKSAQNKDVIFEISSLIRASLNELVLNYEIKHICYVPPTIDRKVQILDTLKQYLDLNVPEIYASKVPSSTKVAQKSLRKLEDRIENAKKSISTNPTQVICGNILIIDDATGSGATLNETAKKFKNISDNKVKIYGYSIVGSYKGFDVISEV